MIDASLKLHRSALYAAGETVEGAEDPWQQRGPFLLALSPYDVAIELHELVGRGGIDFHPDVVILQMDMALAVAPSHHRGYATLATAVAKWAPLLEDIGAPVVLATVARGRHPPPIAGRKREAASIAVKRAVEQSGADVAATLTG